MCAVMIARQTLKRLPQILQVLRAMRQAGRESVPASVIAQALHMGQVQIRKDIASVSSRPGRPMLGFSVDALIGDIEAFLTAEDAQEAVLVGVGALGRALMCYPGFAEKELRIVAGFDICPHFAGEAAAPVYPMEELVHICGRLNIQLGIIATPAEAAQDVCDQLVAAGVRAVWNFAPTFLKVPEGVLVQNERLSSSLALLSRALKEREEAGE